MAREYFGTDGIRARANSSRLNAEIALRVGMATGRYFVRGEHRHRAVIGKDTRLSGYMIENALTSGLTSVGMDVILVGPMPTPAVAMLTKSLRADVGIMISASHNPFQDNGIKLFGPDGFKLSDEVETQIEGSMESAFEDEPAASADLGRARRLDDVEGRYIEFAKNTFPRGLTLEGRKLILDCAHGAAYKVAPRVFWELGAEIETVGVSPNGFNINDGRGSTHPEHLQDEVQFRGADLGIALDGDADRVVLADETGRLIDGDQMIALIAQEWAKAGRLRKNRVATTTMSNLGLEKFLEKQNIALDRTAVGDRYVVEHMRANDLSLGGEQSGHVILADYSTTGDGILAALQVLAVLVQSDRPASEILNLFEPYPQFLVNVAYNGDAPLEAPAVKRCIEAGEAKLGDNGRLLIRESGTEPLIRVMGEGEDATLVEALVRDIASEIDKAAQA